METTTSYARGVKAEEEAEKYLHKAGYKILEHRYKTKFGEVDFIVCKKNILCFVEVKIRKNQQDALESVTKRIRSRIEKSALFFLSQYPEYAGYDMRFDVITMNESFVLVHLDNAWEAGA